MSYILGRPFWTTHALGLVFGHCSDPATKGRLGDLEAAHCLDTTLSPSRNWCAKSWCPPYQRRFHPRVAVHPEAPQPQPRELRRFLCHMLILCRNDRSRHDRVGTNRGDRRTRLHSCGAVWKLCRVPKLIRDGKELGVVDTEMPRSMEGVGEKPPWPRNGTKRKRRSCNLKEG
ncbi:hypothetical protein KC325_g214 [Hortaea werneckii]|nr:hypothetical protein KC325_g214 [Hortaea werneckii]